jgi:hypothetical protein
MHTKVRLESRRKEYLEFYDIKPPNTGEVMRIIVMVRVRTILVTE